MRTKDEIQSAIAQILKELRETMGASKAKMAANLGVDERTYTRYESGESCPTLAVFISMLDNIEMPVMPVISRYLYPELYAENSGVDELRRWLADYMLYGASDREVQQIYYILEGKHGSPREAQVQLFAAFDHLPIDARLTVAKLLFNIYEIEDARGELINTSEATPDIELLHNALIKATLAVIEGRSSYSAGLKS